HSSSLPSGAGRAFDPTTPSCDARGMARLPYVDPEDPAADPRAAELLRAIKLSGGDVNLLKALANHAEILQAFMGFAGPAYFTSSLEPGLRELAYLTASAANRCHY